MWLQSDWILCTLARKRLMEFLDISNRGRCYTRNVLHQVPVVWNWVATRPSCNSTFISLFTFRATFGLHGSQVVWEFFHRAVEWSVCHVRRSNALHLGQSVRMHQHSAKLSELSVLLVFFDSENCCARPNACGRQGWHFLHYFLLSLTVAVCLKCSVRPWAAVRRGPRMERM